LVCSRNRADPVCCLLISGRCGSIRKGSHVKTRGTGNQKRLPFHCRLRNTKPANP
jgi:hypothetical protein